jgi:oleate hydratase
MMANMNKHSPRKAHIIGGGIAGLATAAFLIRDGGMKGGDIFIYDRESKGGGSFDGGGSATSGYLSRGYRMFEESVYLSTYDLLENIPSPENPEKSLKDDFFDFNKKISIRAKARLMEKANILDASRMELDWRDRLDLIRFLYYPESWFGTKKISDFFSRHFFMTNFWFMWATTYAFQPWHSVLEMRRYLTRFVHDAPQCETMSCVLSAPNCEHDFIIVPLLNLLKENGVHFLHDREVTDLDFAPYEGKKAVTGISFKNNAHEKTVVSPDDLVFITNGSMMADATVGSMEKPPSLPPKNSSSWALWKNIARKSGDFGKPEVFCASPQKSNWESFTVTMRDSLFSGLLYKLTGNKAGTGGLTTFKDSNWMMTIGVPYQPYFKNQPDDVFVFWGYGLHPDKVGNFVKKKMSECGGKEIMEELCCHLGFGREASEIIKSAVCIPCFMPFITAQFSPRNKPDRPEVVPKTSHNFAFIGQFVEIPHEIVFTVECSIRSAKIAVKKLLNLSGKIPALHQRKYNIKVLFNGIKTILR